MNMSIRNKAFNNLPGKQGGLYIVEFAIVGFAALLILFGSLEVCRMMFTVNVLEEATRRGARVAAVCTLNNPAIAEATIFSHGGGTSSVLPNLTIANVDVQYLSATGAPIADTSGNNYFDIEFVRVEIVDYEHEMILPGLNLTFDTRGYPTIIPRESLGVSKTSVTTC
jgi:Flp pilus assembly protein TadG